MRMDKQTAKFQIALADAQSVEVGRDHQFIEPNHLPSATRGYADFSRLPPNRARCPVRPALSAVVRWRVAQART